LFAPYRGLDRRVYLLAATRCVNTMGFSIVMPFMAMYLVEQRHAKGATYGLVYLIAGLAASLSQGISGELADRLGRRRVMITALGLRAINMIALGVAVTRGASVNVLGLLIVSNGVLRALFEPAAAAAVTELAPPELRIAAFGLQRIGVNVGWALGPALGGAFAHASYGAMFFFAAPMTLLAGFAAAQVADRPRTACLPEAQSRLTPRALLRTLRDHPRFVSYLGLVLGGSILTNQLFSTLSVFSKTELGFSEGTIGLVYTVNGLLVVLLQIPATAVIDARGPRFALYAGPIMYSVAYAALGFAHSFTQVTAAVAFLTVGEVVFSPALSDMAVYLGDPRRLGRAFGTFGLAQQLGVSIGPLVGGTVFDAYRHDQPVMWGVLSGLMVIVAVGYARFARGFADPHLAETDAQDERATTGA
jgi:MFS family permease